jgi:mRNA-degrading endonuclease YafQ of YafQ-DinJ toxin-antitoxin module
MIQISLANSFKRAFRKTIKGNGYLEAQYFEKVEMFKKDPFYPPLKTHKLKGALKHLWSFSILSDIRIVFFFKEDGTVIFENIGSHDEVY